MYIWNINILFVYNPLSLLQHQKNKDLTWYLHTLFYFKSSITLKVLFITSCFTKTIGFLMTSLFYHNIYKNMKWIAFSSKSVFKFRTPGNVLTDNWQYSLWLGIFLFYTSWFISCKCYLCHKYKHQNIMLHVSCYILVILHLFSISLRKFLA